MKKTRKHAVGWKKLLRKAAGNSMSFKVEPCAGRDWMMRACCTEPFTDHECSFQVGAIPFTSMQAS